MRQLSVFKKPFVNVTVNPACVRNEIDSAISSFEVSLGKIYLIRHALEDDSEIAHRK